MMNKGNVLRRIEVRILSWLCRFIVLIMLAGVIFLPASFHSYSILSLILPAVIIYCVGFHLPHDFAPAAIFLGGGVLDIIVTAPIGFLPFLFLLCYSAGIVQKHFFINRSFVKLWASFSLFWIGFSFLRLWIFSWFGVVHLEWHYFLYQLIIAMVCFPLIHVIFLQIGYYFSD